MASSNALVTRFSANIQDFERELKRLQTLNAKAAAKLAQDQARAAQRSAKAWNDNDFTGKMSKQFKALGNEIKSLAPIIAGAFSAREILAAAETYTRLTNQLKVAGLSGQNLAQVQEQLYQIAQRNGVELESLATLYGRAAGAAGELGASQADLVKFTSTVSTALRVTGGDAASASGALLQLSQALSGGKIQAEEYNSLIDGVRPLLEAAAAGSDRWGGSVAKLTKDVKAGTVTSKEFFEAVLAGSEMLEGKAANAATTVSQAFTVLSNAFTKYIGEANQATGATSVLVNGITALAEHLPEIANALAVIAGIYAATFVPSVVRATSAVIANGAAMASTAAVYNVASRSIAVGATAMNGARIAATGLSAALGGPLGIALTAITVAMGYWIVKSAEEKQRTAELVSETHELAEKLGVAEQATLDAAKAHGQVSKASVIAGAKMRDLSIDVKSLTDDYQLLAEAARQAAYDQAQLALTDAQTNYNKRYQKEKNAATPTVVTFGRDPKDRAYGIKDGSKAYEAEARKKTDASDEGRALREAEAVIERLKDPASRQAFVEDGKPKSGTDTGTGTKTGKGKTVSNGDNEMRQLEIEARNLMLEQTTDLDARLQLQKEILALEEEGKIEAIKKRVKDGQLTQAAGDELIQKETANAKLRESGLIEDNRKAVAERALQLEDDNTKLQAEKLRQEADELEEHSQLAKTYAQRKDYALDALDKRQEADRLEFDLAQKQYEADLKLLGLTNDEIAQKLAARQKTFNAGQASQSRAGIRDANAIDPSIKDQIVGQAESFGSLNKQIGGIATGALDDLSQGLTDAVMGTKSLKEAFSDMARSIIAQLIQMAIRFVIFEAIGAAIGVPGLGKAAIGVSTTSKPSVSVGANATGTNNWPGGLSMVGEKGPELMYLPQGSQIAPNNLLKTALQQRQAPSASGNINLYTTVNASDAVLTSQVKQWITESQVQSVQAAQKLTNRDQTRRQRNTLYR